MRSFLLPVLLAISGAPALAQAPGTAPSAPTPGDGRPGQRIERIHVEDAGGAVDEVRYGGQTQSIQVRPKADVPSYEILPEAGPHQRTPARDGVPGGAGQRVWNVHKF